MLEYKMKLQSVFLLLVFLFAEFFTNDQIQRGILEMDDLDDLNHVDPLHDVERALHEIDQQFDGNADMMPPTRVQKRYLRDYDNPYEFFRDRGFKNRYRFTKDVVMYYILPLIRGPLERPNNRGLPVPLEIEIIMFLRFAATGNFQEVQGDLRGFTQRTVCSSIHRVAKALAALLPRFVHFPATEREQLYNIHKFYKKAGFPGVGGVIDGSLIPIGSPGRQIAEIFRCRKGFYAMNLVVVVDPRGKILFIDARHPGGVHDQTAAERSALVIIFEENRVRGFLLGDKGYACAPYLMTPFVGEVQLEQLLYNRAHGKTRNVVECTFGRWKRKFPCLRRGLLTNIDNTIPIICACAVLCNIHIDFELFQ